jgi:hypothetical protein
VIGKLFLPGIFLAGFFLYTHQPARSNVALAYVSQACDTAPPGVSATFAWAPTGDGAEQTWVDVSLDPAFGLGWYQGHGPLPPAQNTLSVAGLALGLKYYYRVNTLYAGKWRTSAKGSFVAACAATPVAPADRPALDATPGPAPAR